MSQFQAEREQTFARLAELHARKVKPRVELDLDAHVDPSSTIASAIRDALRDAAGWCSSYAGARNGDRCVMLVPAFRPDEPCPACGLPIGRHVGRSRECRTAFRMPWEAVLPTSDGG